MAKLLNPNVLGIVHDRGGAIFNIKAFGGIGDGVADDTAARDRALAEAPNASVLLPAGRWRFTTMTDLGLQKSLIGAGREVSTLLFTGAGIAVSMGDAAAVGVPAAVNGRLTDLTVEGQGYNVAGTIGVRIIKCLFPIVERVTVKNIELGFKVDGDDEFAALGYMLGCRTQNVTNGFLLTADAGKQVNGMTFVACYAYGHGVPPAGAYGWKIEQACDTNVLIGCGAEGFNGVGSKGFWITANPGTSQRLIGVRAESCTQDFVLDSWHNLVIPTLGDVTDNSDQNTVIEQASHRRPYEWINYAAAINPDAKNGELKEIGDLAGAITVNNPTNARRGHKITFMFKQDAVGGRVITWGTKYRPGTWAPSVAANARNTITFTYLAPLDLWLATASAVGLAA